MQKKYAGIIFILSVINWIPIIVYVFLYPPLPFTVIFLLLSFCSPVIAIVYIVTVIVMMFMGFSKVSLAMITIAVNLSYLLWSKYYLDVLYHMT